MINQTPEHPVDKKQPASITKPKLGRPLLGSEAERLNTLLDHALTIFMRDGYGLASIAKIASAAGVSTRTIYERYANKADLMVASVSCMVGRDIEQMQAIAGLENMLPQAGLAALGHLMLERVTSPGLVSFYRIVVAEAARFPEFTNKMKANGPQRIQGVIADYLAQQVAKGNIQIENSDKAAAMFCHMLISEPRHKAVLGFLEDNWDVDGHIAYVVKIFLYGISNKKQLEESNR